MSKQTMVKQKLPEHFDHMKIATCSECHKPMDYHVTTTTAICKDCDRALQVRIYMTVTRHRLKKQWESK